MSSGSINDEVAQRTPFVGALMLVGWQWVREQVFEGVRAAGYDDLNPAHVGLVRYPTLDGLRPIDIATRMQITKQSVHDLLGHMEQRGYLVREDDPGDRRARVVRLTDKGQRWSERSEPRLAPPKHRSRGCSATAGSVNSVTLCSSSSTSSTIRDHAATAVARRST